MKDNALITAPDQEILPGITRMKVIELAILNGIPIKYESINSADFSDIESVFLTGTSPKVLPVRRVGDLPFRMDHPLVQKLVEDYNDLRDRYIARVLDVSTK